MSQGKPFKLDLFDLGGGLSEEPPSHLQDRELSRLENFYPTGSGLLSRRGISQITENPYSNLLTSLFAFKQSVGTWLLLVGYDAGIAKQDGPSIVALTNADATPVLSGSYPWIFKQYKDEVLAARRGATYLRRVMPDFFQRAGIDAPTLAPVISEGGAGSKEAGNRKLVYTFYVRETGAESNPSPASNQLNLSASKKLVANSIGISTNPQVNARRLYETAPNQAGEYYFVKQVDDNTNQGPIENDINIDNLGRQVSFENGLPPVGIEAIEIWQERLFATDGKAVFWSRLGFPQQFSEFDTLPVYEDDGHKIVDLVAWGDTLAVAKTNGMHLLRGSGPSRFSLDTLSEKHGARGLSTKSAEGLLLWYSGENIYRSDGVGASAISTLRVRKLLDRITEDKKDLAVGEILPRLSLYLLSVPLDGATENSHIIAYNYKTNAWGLIRMPVGVTFLGRFYTTSFEEVLYALFATDRRVFQIENGDTDSDILFGSNIKAIARTKAFGDTSLRGVQWVGVLTPALNETAKVRVYVDGVAHKVRTMSLARGGWKRVNISTMNKLGTEQQVEIEYEGKSQLELQGLAVRGMAFPARVPKAS